MNGYVVAGLQHENWDMTAAWKKNLLMPHFGGVLFGMYVMYPYIYIHIFKHVYIYIRMYSLFEILMIEVCHQTNQLPMGQIQESSQPASFCQPLPLKIQLLSQQKQQTCAVSKASSRPGLDRWNISETISSTTGATGATGTTGDTGVLLVLLSITTISDHTISSGGTVAERTVLPTQGPLVPWCLVVVLGWTGCWTSCWNWRDVWSSSVAPRLFGWNREWKHQQNLCILKCKFKDTWSIHDSKTVCQYWNWQEPHNKLQFFVTKSKSPKTLNFTILHTFLLNSSIKNLHPLNLRSPTGAAFCIS